MGHRWNTDALERKPKGVLVRFLSDAVADVSMLPRTYSRATVWPYAEPFVVAVEQIQLEAGNTFVRTNEAVAGWSRCIGLGVASEHT